MLAAAILFVLVVLSAIFLEVILRIDVARREDICQATRNKNKKLEEELGNLRKDNVVLNEDCEDTVALFDMTKDICSSLDEDRLFGVFKERVSRYVSIDDCCLLKKEEDVKKFPGYELFPLAVNNNTVGYLAAKGIKGDSEEKFHILAHQFILGLKRALLYKKIQDLSIVDTLTGIFNRRYFLERFDEELNRSRNFNLKCSFLMIDLDYFKEINDRYGHLVGDAVLKAVANSVKSGIRQIDFMGRYGGEELSVLLTETDKEQAILAAERIRKNVESQAIRVYDEDLKVTVSIGISSFPEDAAEAKNLIETADKALYQAKEKGRNAVCIYASKS